MIDQIENQEIELSLLLLACGYAATIVALVIWFAGHVS